MGTSVLCPRLEISSVFDEARIRDFYRAETRVWIWFRHMPRKEPGTVFLYIFEIVSFALHARTRSPVYLFNVEDSREHASASVIENG